MHAKSRKTHQCRLLITDQCCCSCIAQVTFAAMDFTLVKRCSWWYECFAKILITCRFDSTTLDITFNIRVIQFPPKIKLRTGILFRRTSYFFRCGCTVIPAILWHTVVTTLMVMAVSLKTGKNRSYCSAQNLFIITWREEYPCTRKILEGGTTFRCSPCSAQ